MSAKQQLESIFGVEFIEKDDIETVRGYESPNTFCLNEDGDVIAIFSTEVGFSNITIPRSLKKLQYLNLNDNGELKALKFECALPELWHFDISDSRLVELKFPAGFDNLRWLDASRNQLKTFIPQGQFKQLTYLDLSGNQLNDFSTALLPKFSVLKGLYLKGNENFPTTKNASINKQGNALAFMERFARELEKGETVNNEFKVLVVGNGGVGKTCLVERLVYDSFETKHLSTHGIALEQYSQENEGDFPFVLNIWDFGGQDIYHATHRLFMQSNAVYLALWDQETLEQPTSKITEDEKEREYENFSLQYWLHYIKHQGKNSPVIVVKTKSQENGDYHPKQQDIKDKYGVTEFLQIDSKVANWTDNGINRLLFVVKETIEKLKQDQALPQNWADLRQHLRVLQRDGNQVLSIEEYVDIASDYDIESPLEVLTDWLVTSGVVFYREGYFGNTILLDQAWAITAIYTIFKRTDNSPYYRIQEKQRGKFTGGDLLEFWKSENFSRSEQELLVSFMLSCELCFELKLGEEDQQVPFEERVFFAPQMMPNKQPDSVQMFLDFHKDKQLLYIRYTHSFLHYGIIQSFIVRAQSFADVSGIWKYGIVLKEGGKYAIVKEVDREIFVITTADNLDLLDKIRNTLEDLQKEKVEELVSLDGVEYVSMEKLRGWNKESIPTINTDNVLPTKDFAIFLERKKQDKFSIEKNMTETEQLVTQIEKEQVIENEETLPNKGVISIEAPPALILFLQANPTEAEISWQEEYSSIEKKVSEAIDKKKLELKKRQNVSLDDIIDAIDDYEPHFIHFSGHGKDEKIDRKGEVVNPSGLVLHNEDKNSYELITPAVLEPQFGALKNEYPHISIVLLSACHSQKQAAAISKAGIYTIGTSDEIIQEAARKFAAGFYRKLAKTMDVPASIKGGISRSISADPKIKELIHLFYNGKKITLKSKK